VFKLISYALHFQKSREAHQLRPKGSSGGTCKTLQVHVGQVCISEKWSEFPCIGNAARFQPGLDGFFAFDAGEFVLCSAGVNGRVSPLPAGEQAAIFRADARIASGKAQALQAIAK